MKRAASQPARLGENRQGLIFDIRRYSVHDGPGIRTTVFFKGCPLRCWWCHNPESLSSRPEMVFRETRCARCGTCLRTCQRGAILWGYGLPLTDAARCDLCEACVQTCPSQAREIAGRWLSIRDVMAVIRRDVTFYDESGGGVTFSGGEPLLQAGFLDGLLQACKAEEIHTALDTSGYAPWKVLDGLRQWVDLFLYDLKLMDDTLHKKYTGVSNRLILSNLKRLARLGHRIVLRLPLIPGITAGEENIQQVSALARELPNIERTDLLPYHDTARLKYQRLGLEYRLPPNAALAEGQPAQIAELFAAYNLRTKIGG